MSDVVFVVIGFGSWIAILASPIVLVLAIRLTKASDRKHKVLRWLLGGFIGFVLSFAFCVVAAVSSDEWGGPAGEASMGQGLAIMLFFVGSLPITSLFGVWLTLKVE